MKTLLWLILAMFLVLEGCASGPPSTEPPLSYKPAWHGTPIGHSGVVPNDPTIMPWFYESP